MSDADTAIAVARMCLGDGGAGYARHLVSASNAVPKLEAEIRGLNGEARRLRKLLDRATCIAARVIADAQVLPSTDSEDIQRIRTEGGLP